MPGWSILEWTLPELIPAVIEDGSGVNKRFWRGVGAGIIDSDQQVHAVFLGDNVLVIEDGDYGMLPFDHVLICSVDRGGQAFLHASDGDAVDPPAPVAVADLQVFINLFHVGSASPVRFLRVSRDESAFRKDAAELRVDGHREYSALIASVPQTRCEENAIFLIYHKKTLKSKGALCESIGHNVLVLSGREHGRVAFSHVLVLAVDEHQYLRLLASDGVVLEPPMDVEKEDLIHFALHYHDRPEISPARFFRFHGAVPLAPGEGGPEENRSAPSEAATRNPRCRAGEEGGEANPDAGIGWARYHNPQRRGSPPRRHYGQRTVEETPRETERSRGNPARGSGGDGDNPVCAALERMVGSLRW